MLGKGALSRSYNIGGHNEARNIDLVRTICGLLDALRPAATSYADLITFVTDRPGHDARYAIDATRIGDELGWVPSVTLEEGLRKTVQWYLDNETWWRALQGRKGVGAAPWAGRHDSGVWRFGASGPRPRPFARCALPVARGCGSGISPQLRRRPSPCTVPPR